MLKWFINCKLLPHKTTLILPWILQIWAAKIFQHFSMSNISGRLISNNRKFKQVLMFLKICMSFCYGEMFAILFYFQIHEKSNYLDVQNVSIRPSFGLSNIIKTKWWFKSPVYRRAIRRRFIELPGERTNILLRCVSSKIIKSYLCIF